MNVGRYGRQPRSNPGSEACRGGSDAFGGSSGAGAGSARGAGCAAALDSDAGAVAENADSTSRACASTSFVAALIEVSISFAADFSMRPGPTVKGAIEPSVERADLHALLVRGHMRAEIRGRSVDLGETYPFLFAERMLDLTRRALDAWERGQPFFARVDAGGMLHHWNSTTGVVRQDIIQSL